LIVFGAFLLACSGLGAPAAPRAGDAVRSADPVPAASLRYLRVIVARDGDIAAIDATDLVDLADVVAPTPPEAADYLLVAYSGGAARDAVFVDLPRRILADGPSGALTLDIAKSTSLALIPFAADVDRIDLLGAQGVLDSVPLAGLGGAPVPSPSGSLLSLWVRSARGESLSDALRPFRAITLANGQTVWLLQPAGRSWLDPAAMGVPVEITPSMEVMIRKGLEQSTPAVRSAVRIIGVTKGEFRSYPTYLGLTAGSTVLLSQEFFQRTWSAAATGDVVAAATIHEAAHAYANTFSPLTERDLAQVTLAPGQSPIPLELVKRHFPPALTALATARSRSYLMGATLGSYWAMLHASGYPALTEAYDTVPRGENDEARDWGFTGWYGSTNVNDDIAEYVAYVQAAPVHIAFNATSTYAESANPFCEMMKAELGRSPEQFDQRVVIPYAKLNLLRILGFITTANYRRCVGQPLLEKVLDEAQPGVHLFKPGKSSSPDSTYRGNAPGRNALTAGWGGDETTIFKVLSSGSGVARDDQSMYSGDWDVSLFLEDPGSVAWGIHNLDRDWVWGAHNRAKAFLQLEKPGRTLFQSRSGLAAVTYLRLRRGILCEVRGLLLPSFDTGNRIFLSGFNLGPGPAEYDTVFGWGAFWVVNPNPGDGCEDASNLSVSLPPPEEVPSR
jgi:hypothetical protein